MIFKNLRRKYLDKNDLLNGIIPVIKYALVYFLFWMVYFFLSRTIFLIYHSSLTNKLDAHLILDCFIHGLKMDISFSSYLTIIFFSIVAAGSLFSGRFVSAGIRYTTLLFLIIVSILSVADLELFKEWGYRLDATSVSYLNTPIEMAASVSSSPYVKLIISIIITIIVGHLLLKRIVYNGLVQIKTPTLPQSMVHLVLAALLIIPVRGGLQLAPMNQSVAYFSKNDFANQAAINVPWNFFWSLTKQLHSRTNPYQYMDEDHADALVETFYSQDKLGNTKVLKSSRPNIIIIIWESLSAKVLPILGGDIENVVPELEARISQGLLFDSFYANGNRSDKGIVAILSGYPSQPKRSIVKIPSKSSKLPSLTAHLNEEGYHTAYMHGGELEFANIKSYLVQAGFDQIIGKNDFQASDMNSKWGAHDHVVLQRAMKEISKQSTPFFNVIFTLSSHEPFEIPTEAQFPGEDLESLYKSSLFYTDQSIATFLNEAEQQSWYENSLIIILADHGHRLLTSETRFEKDRFHIPMLWLGGALSVRDSVIHDNWSQSDVASTILNQLNLGSSEFVWSRDIFTKNPSNGIFYVFNEGYGFVKGNQQLIYDHQSSTVLVKSKNIGEEQITLGKAHLQKTFQDYLNK